MSSENINITHFSVGNGNCSLIEAPDFVMIIDLNKTEDSDSSYDLLKPYFRKKDGKDCIDVLCISHGDEDHCLNFKKFKEKIYERQIRAIEHMSQKFNMLQNISL